MTRAYLYEAIRTGRGKAKPGGGLAQHTPLQLLTALLTEISARHGLSGDAVDDVLIGTATQTGAQGGNIARTAAILAGWGETTPGMTLNRFCASGIDAINTAAAYTNAAMAELIVAGGVESVSHTPMYSDHAPLFEDPDVVERTGSVAMGIAADLIATLEGFDRPELDAYGVRTQRLAAEAWQAGRFDGDVVRIGDFASDEAIRPATTLESVAQLPALFAQFGADGQDDLVRRHHPDVGEIRHVHTVATSPTIVDAAAITLIGGEAAGARHGLRPRARIVSAASVAGNPVIMLTAAQQAVLTALERAGLHPDDVAVFEVAEAFAASCLKFQRDLKVTGDRFNPNGGTIAMGHAFGATGAILAANCVGELERRGERYSVIAVSGAAGLGSATVLERVV
ncbi:acetyl-CoA C-acetyltransferase [Kibdelosporangium banguiense]|uniref:Acetyl-CoA C-acetyltransferase n=1 Tax=Kibdelosporangium banguiense TaxID=1365924 RepID=A0ABS4TZ13_9PSEU|nr:acetyl-CoA C-acyltransferase [Kibdelosporangium banguiense]MBP2329657.1 acetyl-CoA C-acetyltransferase [Kibdelosporangium banguiense]